jgi:serine/threonine protein kinase
MPEWLGKTIGKVRIDKLLARGGTAEVYLGTHLNLGRPVTIKVLHSYIEEEPILLERFHREARVVAALRHSNIVQIFDFDTIDGHPYIVMEYLRGPTLSTYLRHLHQRKKRVPFYQIAHLLNGLTAALDYAHGQGVIHRDIKPANILLYSKTDEIPLDRPLPGDVEAVVTDFGLVRVTDATSHTTSGIISGTPMYMSPEQALGAPIDYRTDIYSLGIMLYEMLAGRVPFAADNTVTILHMHVHTAPLPIPGIAAKMQAVVERALQKKPDVRYQTGQEMASDFYSSIGISAQGETIPEPYPAGSVPGEAPALTKPEPARSPEPTPKPLRSRVGISTVLFSVLALSILAIGGYLIFGPDRNLPPPAARLSTVTANTISSSLLAIPSSIPPTPILGIASTPTLKPTSNPSSTRTSIPPTPTLGIGSTIISDKDGMTLLYVPAGEFTMGSNDGNLDEMPLHKVILDAFWIDKTEVTNAMYAKCVTDGNCDPPSSFMSATRDKYYGNPEFNNFPVLVDKWDKANAYCSWANRSLPTEAQWEKAARGTDAQTYPWGNTPPNNNLLNYNNATGDTTEVGKYPMGASPYGVLDMAGNVWEWVSDFYVQNYYATLGENASNPPGPPESLSEHGYHVVRGGSWYDNSRLVRSAFRGGNFPAYEKYKNQKSNPTNFGFRCAMTATP